MKKTIRLNEDLLVGGVIQEPQKVKKMFTFKSDKNYVVEINLDGDDYWVNVGDEYCHEYQAIVGTLGDGLTNKERLENAETFFFPTNYVRDILNEFPNGDGRYVLNVATDAFEIERALKLAINVA